MFLLSKQIFNPFLLKNENVKDNFLRQSETKMVEEDHSLSEFYYPEDVTQ